MKRLFSKNFKYYEPHDNIDCGPTCLRMIAHFHGKSFFEKDIEFSIEAKKIIKSMQFRLDSFKSEYINTESSRRVLVNTFKTKILSNLNIGLEFYKHKM